MILRVRARPKLGPLASWDWQSVSSYCCVAGGGCSNNSGIVTGVEDEVWQYHHKADTGTGKAKNSKLFT